MCVFVCVSVCLCVFVFDGNFYLTVGLSTPPVCAAVCGDSAKYGLCVLYEGRREGRGVVLLQIIEILIV